MRSPRSATFAVATSVLLLAPFLAAHASVLRPAGVVQTAQGTSAMTSADLDGDGHLDLIVANASQNTVSFFHGDGNGHFAKRTDLAAGLSPFAVAVGDMNGDGVADLAVGNEGDHTVDLMLGAGGGAFEDARVVPVGAALRLLAFRPKETGADLLVARDQEVEVLTLEGNEISSSTFPFGCGFGEVLAGDFDADHVLDLLGIGSVSMAVMHGRADGGFDPHVDLFWQDGQDEYLQFWWAAAGDMNGDGIDDVVAGTYHHGRQFVDVGAWSGGAVPGPRIPSPDLGLPVAVGDLDGDGHADVVAVKSHSRGVTAFLGDGQGGLALEAEYASGERPFKAEIGDFDEDGHADLAVLNYDSATISLFGHRGPRALAGPTPVEPAPATVDGQPRIETVAPTPARASAATRIDFRLPSAGEATLTVFDAAGRKVIDLLHAPMTTGRHSVDWTAPGPGVYFVRLTANGRHAARSLAVVRQ